MFYKISEFPSYFILYPLRVTPNQTKRELSFPVFTFRALKLNHKILQTNNTLKMAPAMK